MIKTIIRIIVVILVFVGVLWVGGSNWNDFKRGTDMKDPADVYAPVVEKIPDIDDPNDVITDPGKPDLTSSTDFTSDDGIGTLDYQKETEGIVEDNTSAPDFNNEDDVITKPELSTETANNTEDNSEIDKTEVTTTEKSTKKEDEIKKQNVKKADIDWSTVLTIDKKSIDFATSRTITILDWLAINYKTGVNISIKHKDTTTTTTNVANNNEAIIANAGFTPDTLYDGQLESKEELDCLVNTISVVKELPNGDDYNRTVYEKPIQSYKIDDKSYNRNDFAWKTSPYFNEEEFTYTCPYTGTIIKDSDDKKEDKDFGNLDFDHIVPLKSTYIRGAKDWTDEQKNTYAYDQFVGVDVLNSANRSKSDKGPTEYLPDINVSDYCYSWLLICSKYNLVMTEDEMQICLDNINIELENGNTVQHMGYITQDTKQ